MKVLSSLKFENMLLRCHLHHPPPHPLTSCPASTPHSAHLAGAAPSFQKLRSSHHLAKILSSAVSKVSWCCLNSYRSAIITAFSFSPRMCGDNRGLGVVVEKRMHSESERISGHLAAQTYTFRKRELNQSGFLKTLLWVSRDAALIFTFFFTPSLSPCASRPWIFLISNGYLSCYFTLTLLPCTIVSSLTRERKASSCLFTRSANRGIISQWAWEVGVSGRMLV